MNEPLTNPVGMCRVRPLSETLSRFIGHLELTRFRGHQNMKVNHDAKYTQTISR